MHILLVEDNQAIADSIQEYLQLDGRSVDVFADGISGLEQASGFTYDCIVLDVMLPGMDGFSLLAELRKTKQTPVIMTTAKGQLDDKQEGYDAGADDYLVKPFELQELMMRIQALVKRSAVSDIVRRRDIEIDMERNVITKNGTVVDITLKEWQVLGCLLNAEGSTVQRTTIIDEIWGDTGVWDEKSDGKLDVYIANLRKKLEKGLIETVKGVGYRLGV